MYFRLINPNHIYLIVIGVKLRPLNQIKVDSIKAESKYGSKQGNHLWKRLSSPKAVNGPDPTWVGPI